MTDTNADYRHTGGLFVSPHPNETTHVYSEDNPADGFKSDLWRESLCGKSHAKVNGGKSYTANREAVDCGSCLNHLSR